MSETQYNPFLNPPSTGESARDQLANLDPAYTYVINPSLATDYINILGADLDYNRSLKLKKIGRHYLVGEHHRNPIPVKHLDDFRSNLANSNLVVTEGFYSDNQLSGIIGKGFMGQAQKYAQENSKPFISLDEELRMYYPSKSQLWLEKGALNPDFNVTILECLSASLNYLLIEHTNPQVIIDTIPEFAKIITGISTKEQGGVLISQPELDLITNVTTKATEIFIKALSNEEIMSGLCSLVHEYNGLDAVFRDSAYNWIIRKELGSIPGAKAVVVVGKNHFSAVEFALEGLDIPKEKIREAQLKTNTLFDKLNSLVNISESR